MRLVGWIPFAFGALSACSRPFVLPAGDPALRAAGEDHFGDVRQVTFDGDATEPAWSPDGRWIAFQRAGEIRRVRSTGKDAAVIYADGGRAAGPSYFPDGEHVLFALDQRWLYSIFPDGQRLTPAEPGAPTSFNSEGSVCRDGSVVFTSGRDGGDLELYTAKIDGALGTIHDVARVTNAPGYDGNASFSPDCAQLTWQATRPAGGKELEIWAARSDGSGAHRVTLLGGASSSPVFTPDSRRILFAYQLNLYLVNPDGTGLERVTEIGRGGNSPRFSPDGRYLAFSSQRGSKGQDIFVADWREGAPSSPASNESRPADHFLSLMNARDVPAKIGGCGGSVRPVVIVAGEEPSALAAVTEVARLLEHAKGCYVFAKGRAPARPRPKAVLYVAQAGSLRDNRLPVSGASAEWRALLDGACASQGLACPPTEGDGSALVFRTDGAAGPVNATGGIQVARAIAEVARRVAEPRRHFTAPKMVAVVPPAPAASRPSDDLGMITSGGATKGGGVALTGVHPGSAADRAGARFGDVVLSVNGQELKNVQVFKTLLRRHKPGQKVILVVRRAEQVVKLEIATEAPPTR